MFRLTKIRVSALQMLLTGCQVPGNKLGCEVCKLLTINSGTLSPNPPLAIWSSEVTSFTLSNTSHFHLVYFPLHFLEHSFFKPLSVPVLECELMLVSVLTSLSEEQVKSSEKLSSGMNVVAGVEGRAVGCRGKPGLSTNIANPCHRG